MKVYQQHHKAGPHMESSRKEEKAVPGTVGRGIWRRYTMWGSVIQNWRRVQTRCDERKSPMAYALQGT